jgi:Heterokaryon incompatibility protein Het-C
MLPHGGGGNPDQRMSEAENLKAKSKAYHFDPNNVAPPEIRRQLMDLLRWHDSIYRDVLSAVEMVPGLASLIDNLTNALNACAPCCL